MTKKLTGLTRITDLMSSPLIQDIIDNSMAIAHDYGSLSKLFKDHGFTIDSDIESKFNYDIHNFMEEIQSSDTYKQKILSIYLKYFDDLK